MKILRLKIWQKNEIDNEEARAIPTHGWFIQGAVSFSQGQRGQSSPSVFTPNDLQHSEPNDSQSPKHLVGENSGGTELCGDMRLLRRTYLDTWRHANVEVAQDVLAVLVLGGLAQEGQKSSGFFAAVSHLVHTQAKETWRRLAELSRAELS